MEALTHALRSVAAGALAVDTEGDSFHHYPEKVCLIQLSHGVTDLLIDPLALDPAPLGPLLADAGQRKILHGADYDLRVLHRDFAFEVRGLFDTMIAARLTGETAFGLAALLERLLGVRADKRFQRADWSLRPLTAEMREYAVTDTRHLAELTARLEERLVALGRIEWAREEFERLERVRWSAASDDPEAYRRIKRSGDLSRRELAVLRELVRSREELARAKDRPPFRVLADEVLLELARRKPRGRGELQGVPRAPRGWPSGRVAETMLAAVQRGLELPENELPEQRRGERRRLDPEFEARVKRLARHRDRVAEDLGLEPSLLAPKSVLIELQRRLDEGREPEGAEDLRRWQADQLLPGLSGPA